jgi:hypothetical protein
MNTYHTTTFRDIARQAIVALANESIQQRTDADWETIDRIVRRWPGLVGVAYQIIDANKERIDRGRRAARQYQWGHDDNAHHRFPNPYAA